MDAFERAHDERTPLPRTGSARPCIRGHAPPVVLGILALALCAAALAEGLRQGRRYACIDFYQFWVVGRAVSAGDARDIYSAAERERLGQAAWQRARTEADALGAQRKLSRHLAAARQRQVLETFSTPWLYTVFGALATADYERDQARFQALSTVLYALGVLYIAHALGYSAWVCALWLAAVMIAFHPFTGDVSVGNVGRLQIALAALYIAVSSLRRFKIARVAAGAVLGASLAFKPNLAVIVVLLGTTYLGHGRTRDLVQLALGVCLGIAAACLTAGLYFGSLAPWSQWLAEMPKLMAQGVDSEGNYALRAVWRDTLGFPAALSAPIVWVAGTIVVLAFARRRERGVREPSVDGEVLCVGLAGALATLTPELVWPHYALLAVPLFLYLLRPARFRSAGALERTVRILATGAAFVAVAFEPLRRLAWVQDQFAPVIVTSGVALACLAALADAVYAKRARATG